jgi:hypothetical protein
MERLRHQLPAVRQVVFIAGLVLLLLAGIGYVWVQGPLSDAIALERDLARTTGRIMTLDELLTMSARMAAATRNPTYEARYNANVGELDALLQQAIARVDDAQAAEAMRAADAANRRLVELETRSFWLDKQQRGDDALALLESDAYRADKASYAAGVQSAFARLEEITATRRIAVARWALALQITALIALIAVAVGWLLEARVTTPAL